ncbi:hypothetical protein Ae168Ps1_1442c [Pseudonocardia sp. Ae168_Ps1]|nr:hypothetical protein Ae150APs1_1439c [Pseudonocardia sp. Ae150A_Ps1]OLL79036.1 hypothetical protein Ae168Ps1_1442c [Pseudonocardia sp. Ae168_Ps1]OLL86826.1 hypothetical protein Ae263Ps1_3881 [Pseudonocardia sp. Ae263_Ps1]OLL93130.1 hypothetical protein Ae356Ps1_3027c [Pseudonocardia sp. Ae356_Ps1]
MDEPSAHRAARHPQPPRGGVARRPRDRPAGRPARVAAEHRIERDRPRSAEDPYLFDLHTRIVAALA